MTSPNSAPARSSPAHASPSSASRLLWVLGQLLPACMVAYAVVVYVLNGREDVTGLALTLLAVGLSGTAMLVMAALRCEQETATRVRRDRDGDRSWMHRQAFDIATALRQVTLRQQQTEEEIARLRGHMEASVRAGSVEWTRYVSRSDAGLTTITRHVEHLVEELLPVKANDDGARAQECGDEPDREVLVYVGHRVHSLVSRMLERLKATEREQEDPDLLDDLYRIDHLATQLRRAAERLAVLGGRTARRAKAPMPISTVLRQAMAEVEDFTRVRLTLPDDEMEIPGHAGPDVIHVLAELVENATKFSPPDTTVLMSTVQVPSGLGVEIRDQGLPLTTEKLEGLRRILAVPHRISPREQVRQGQIGLLVAARLATRHGLRIELHPDASGTRALVVVPRTLLVAPTTRNAQPSPEAQPPELPRRHRAANPAALVTNHSKGLLTGGAASNGAGSNGSAAATDQPPLPTPSALAEPPRTALGDKPALPRRSQAQPASQPPASTPTSPTTSPGRPPTPGLLSAFTAGIRDAQGGKQNAPGHNQPGTG